MSLEAPSNGIYIVLGEINLLLANLRKTSKYSNSHSHYENVSDPLTRNFSDLKLLLNDQSNLSDIDSSTFLAPFLEVIKSEETTGPVTGLALTSVNKFIAYGLIGMNNETTANCVQQIADSITHARFVGTDSASDEVVLMKILHVLRTLMLSPIGFYLTNSSVCEIMQSCFQIFFENRLTELLRRTAESMLVDMVQLLFARLPQFKEEIKYSAVKKLTMKGENSRQKKSKKSKENPHILTKNTSTDLSHTVLKAETPEPQSSTTTTTTISSEQEQSRTQEDPSISEKFTNLVVTETNDDYSQEPLDTPHPTSTNDLLSESERNQNNFYLAEPNAPRKKTLSESSSCSSKTADLNNQDSNHQETVSLAEVQTVLSNDQDTSTDAINKTVAEDEYVNPRGVRFVQPDGPNAANVPYGLPCLRELLRFLISLINSKNSELMISMGLNLITIGMESGADHISAYQSLLAYVKDDLSKNLFNLLSTERMPIYTSVLRILFLLFESLRAHLKYQLEFIFTKLMHIIVSESTRVSQEQREMTIDFLLQMMRIPGFAIEMYINYDCSPNCTNLFEDLTKLLSKNAFSVQSLVAANSLSLSALLTIVENIELENSSVIKQSMSSERMNMMMLQSSLLQNMHKAPPSSGYSAAASSSSSSSNLAAGRKLLSQVSSSSSANLCRVNRMKIQADRLPTHDQLRAVRVKKRILQQSVDLFNSNPNKSIQFLKDNSIFSQDPNVYIQQLISYLKETPTLDKKVIIGVDFFAI